MDITANKSAGRLATRNAAWEDPAAVPLSLRFPTKPFLTVWLLTCSDVLALFLSALVTIWTKYQLGGDFRPESYWQLWPVLAVFVAGYALAKLYPGVPLNSPEELRRIFIVNSIVLGLLGSATFLVREAEIYSRSIFITLWLLSVVTVYGGRGLTRWAFAHRSWWGYPAIILGAGRIGRRVVKQLKRRPAMGLKPVAMLDDRRMRGRVFAGVQIAGKADLAPTMARKYRRLYVIVAMRDFPDQTPLEILSKYEEMFEHVIVIPDLAGMASHGVVTTDMGGMLGLQVQHRLLDPGRMAVKRCLDLFFIALASPLLLLLTAIVAVLIKLDSPGPVFYGHRRIGRGGEKFTCWKFRSMVHNANEVLAKYLDEHPELRQEWERKRKLRNDPRITRVGKLLRRLSLDEFPQLWNVLTGDMSLVGPRPIDDDEIIRYGEQFNLLTRVRPGVTGLWQVSGRNDLSYAERVRLDVYYVRNWSIWMDLWIFSRTIGAVMTARGAY